MVRGGKNRRGINSGTLLVRLMLLIVLLTLSWYGAILPISKAFPFFGIRHIYTNQPVIALTFDDGPAEPYTKQILNILSDYNAKASFFCIGRQIDRYPAIAQEVLKRGHELGNHSYSHDNLIFKTPGLVWREVEETDLRLRSMGQAGTITMRPPLGKRFLTLPLILWWRRQPLVVWDVDSGDWQANIQTSTLVNNVISKVKPGSIILMHDGESRGDASTHGAATVKALPEILTALQKRGYQFVTVSELIHQNSSSKIDKLA